MLANNCVSRCTSYLSLSHYIHANITVSLGQLGITLNTNWQVPEDPTSQIDRNISDRAIYFKFGWFAEPVIKGDYPQVMKDFIATKSRQQGLAKSRLPEFTTKEKKYMKSKSVKHNNNSLKLCLLKNRQRSIY